MKCPRCAHLNPTAVKFCNECGQMIGFVCSSCDTVNLPESKFCSQCGNLLSQTDRPAADELLKPLRPDVDKRALTQAVVGERKHVTVLFSDMSGYTALAQRLDPEEVRDITARVFHEISTVVAKYEGFIEKFAGDAVMAVFGAVRAHEDDAIRSIIAAREIHERVDAFSLKYEKQIGQILSMHSGINTGLVVTGNVDFYKGTHGIAGAPLNIASRLCSLAKPGEILVGAETYRHSLGYFNFVSLDPVKVKGAEFAGKPARFFQGVVMVGQGQVEEGLHVLEKSCQQWQQNGSRLRFAACGSMLAAVYSDLTRKARAGRQKSLALRADTRAVVYFQSSIESARQIGAKGTLAQAYRNWGNFFKDKGDIDKARDCFSESVAYFRQCGSDALSKQVETEQSALAESPTNKPGINGA